MAGSNGAENRPWQSSGVAQRSPHSKTPIHTLSHPYVIRRSPAPLDPATLGLDPGVEPDELARVAVDCARVGCDLGRVLVVDYSPYSPFEGVPCVDASRVGGNGGSAWVHFSVGR